MTHAPISPITIDPAAWYADGTARLMLDVAGATLVRARRDGELRFARCGARIWYRGQWIIDWLEIAAKEVPHAGQ